MAEEQTTTNIPVTVYPSTTVESETSDNEVTPQEFVPSVINLREDMNLIRGLKTLHVYFDHVELLQDKILSSLSCCLSCTIKIQLDNTSSKGGWVHFHFDSVSHASEMESELKSTFPDGKIHMGEFSPNRDGEKVVSTSDGSRPLERTLCLYNVPTHITETQISSAVGDQAKVTMAVDEKNIFKGYVYLQYKSADEANKAFATYKKDPVQIDDNVIKISKLTAEEKKEKKRLTTPKRKNKKVNGMNPEKQALQASLDALKKQLTTVTEAMERQRLKQRITTLRNMLSSFGKSQYGKSKMPRYNNGMHHSSMAGWWGSSHMGRPYSAGMGYPMARPDMGMPYDYMGTQQNVSNVNKMGRAGRMNGRNNYNTSAPKPSYVSRGKAGYAVLNSKQQKLQQQQQQNKKSDSRNYSAPSMQQRDKPDIAAMMENFQQMNMQQQQQSFNNSAYNYKDNYNNVYNNDYKNSYTNGYHNSNGYSESEYWNSNGMANGNTNIIQQQKSLQQPQQNNWGMPQQQRQVRNGMPMGNSAYQNYM